MSTLSRHYRHSRTDYKQYGIRLIPTGLLGWTLIIEWRTHRFMVADEALERHVEAVLSIYGLSEYPRLTLGGAGC